METISCLNCENHGKYEFKCNINHPNYSNRFEADLSTCFEKNKLHVSMDKMMDILDQINNILDKKIANSREPLRSLKLSGTAIIYKGIYFPL